MFAAVYIPNFHLQAALRSGGDAGPAVLVDGDAVKGTILQLTGAARRAGICEGMSSAQAMARCAGVRFKTRSSDAETSATHVLLQTAAGFSPNIENTAEGICTIDLKGLGFDLPSRTPDVLPAASAAQESFGFLDEVPVRATSDRPSSPIVEWATQIVTALHSLHLEAQVGVASTPDFALLAAQSASPVAVVENEREFVTGLPVEALQPAPEMLDLLHRWGVHRVGQFVALGKDAIAERLGAEALELYDRACARTIRPLDIAVAPDTFEEQIEFESLVETVEPLLFVLHRFVEQLATRIALNYRVVSELTLRLSLEAGGVYERNFKVPAPTSHADTLLRMLQTHLDGLRTESPIVSLRLIAIPCRAENQQFGLFESALRDPNQFHETLARLTALLGPDRVGCPEVEATYRPDAFRMQRPDFDGREHKPAGDRPVPAGLALRRFRPPIHADVSLENGRPVFVRTLLVSGAVRHSRGPWVGSGDWWDQRRWSRNEWDVELRDGALYRLFSARNDWFVEGVYD